MNLLNLDKIRIDGGTQPRCEIDSDLVGEYADAMRDDVEFPPVVAFHDGVDHWLADGFHRYHAARRAGLTALPADVRSGELRDAILYSVGANAAHGKRRSPEDRQKAVLTLLRDEEWATWTQTRIAEVCGVSQQYVSKLANSDPGLTYHSGKSKRTYTTRHGTEATMDTTNIGKTTPKRGAVVAALEDLGEDASNEAIAESAKVAIDLVSRVRREIGASPKRRERQQAAYERLNTWISGTLSGAAMNARSATEPRGKVPSQVTYALEVAADEDVAHWLGVLSDLIGATRKLRKALSQGGDER